VWCECCACCECCVWCAVTDMIRFGEVAEYERTHFTRMHTESLQTSNVDFLSCNYITGKQRIQCPLNALWKCRLNLKINQFRRNERLSEGHPTTSPFGRDAPRNCAHTAPFSHVCDVRQHKTQPHAYRSALIGICLLHSSHSFHNPSKESSFVMNCTHVVFC